jgi:hypothetical protein
MQSATNYTHNAPSPAATWGFRLFVTGYCDSDGSDLQRLYEACIHAATVCAVGAARPRAGTCESVSEWERVGVWERVCVGERESERERERECVRE